jgi:hypothetical protein
MLANVMVIYWSGQTDASATDQRIMTGYPPVFHHGNGLLVIFDGNKFIRSPGKRAK